MKIVLVNHSDYLGGASVVTFRLMQALRRAGADARMLVKTSRTASEYVQSVGHPLRAKYAFLAERLSIFVSNGFNRQDLFKVSTASHGVPISRHPLIEEADAVILNWVNQGYLSMDEIAKIASKKPVVWTMHDMWNATGICHHSERCMSYTYGCQYCPLLHNKGGENDLSAVTARRKASLYAQGKIRFVAVSRWLADRCRQSVLLRGADIRVIGNPVDVDAFAGEPKYSKADLGLPEGRKIVLISSARLDDSGKDLPLAIDTLNRCADLGIVASLVGSIRNPELLRRLRVPYVYHGAVYEPEKVQSLFRHADAVLSTSSFESFGMTLLEGQAAGAVPVGFVHDGRADIITEGVSGYALPDPGLRAALTTGCSPDALRQAALRYSYQSIADQYLALLAD